MRHRNEAKMKLRRNEASDSGKVRFEPPIKTQEKRSKSEAARIDELLEYPL